MNRIFFVFLLLAFCACGRKTYTNNKFFNCPSTAINLDSDKKKMIYLILEEAVVNEKDIPDYSLIKDKAKIYISKTSYSSFMPDSSGNVLEIQLENAEVPSKISNVEFCLKSKTELQAIANKTSDFIYLVLGNIKIEGDIAEIGISTSWQSKSNSKTLYLSGGGYVLQYRKENGEWKYEKTLISWIS